MSTPKVKEVKKKEDKFSPYDWVSARDKIVGAPVYELTLLLRSDMSAQDIKVFFERLFARFTEFEMSLKSLDYWGLRNLKYRIKKNKKSHFYCIRFVCENGKTKDLDRILSINTSVLRFLIMRLRRMPDFKSPMLLNLQNDISEGIVVYDEAYLVEAPGV